MLHHWNKMGFWSHHAVAFCLAAAWIVAVKSFSVARFGADLLQTFFNTTFVLAITWILITAVFELISATNRDQMKFDVRIIVAVVIGAIIASLVAPVFNWVLGTTPPGLDLGTDRNDILAFLTEKMPKRIAGFLLSIAPFWFVTNWGWYAHRESVGVYSTLGQPRRVTTPVSGDNAHAGRQKTVTSMPPAFLRKLPPEKRGALWAITAEQQRELQAKLQRKGFGIGKRISALNAMQGSLRSCRAWCTGRADVKSAFAESAIAGERACTSAALPYEREQTFSVIFNT